MGGGLGRYGVSGDRADEFEEAMRAYAPELFEQVFPFSFSCVSVCVCVRVCMCMCMCMCV